MMKRPTTKLHSVQTTPPANPPSQILLLLSFMGCPRSMRGSVHQNSGFGLLASGRPLGQQGGEDFLVLGECAVHLGADQESVRDATGETEAYFVVDYVAESRAFDPGACFCFEFVAV